MGYSQKCLLLPDRFSNFFNHIDNFPDEAFLFVTSGGIEAAKARKDEQSKSRIQDALFAVDASDSEEDGCGLNDGEGGEG